MPLFFLLLLLVPLSTSAKDLGELSTNPYQQNSTANPFGAGSPFAPNGINNPFSPYGSQYSNKSVTNPFATDASRLYDQQGNYRGKLSANPYDPDSTSNLYGRYGSPFSPDSINNPYGAGSPYRSDSPTNPYAAACESKDSERSAGSSVAVMEINKSSKRPPTTLPCGEIQSCGLGECK